MYALIYKLEDPFVSVLGLIVIVLEVGFKKYGGLPEFTMEVSQVLACGLRNHIEVWVQRQDLCFRAAICGI